MKYFKLVTLGLFLNLFFVPCITFAEDCGDIVSNPEGYADEQAASYSDGDFVGEGHHECNITSNINNGMVIQCSGDRMILFHGGEEIQSSFECEFRFIKRSEKEFCVTLAECG